MGSFLSSGTTESFPLTKPIFYAEREALRNTSIGGRRADDCA
jgi:hypothetical protein